MEYRRRWVGIGAGSSPYPTMVGTVPGRVPLTGNRVSPAFHAKERHQDPKCSGRASLHPVHGRYPDRRACSPILSAIRNRRYSAYGFRGDYLADATGRPQLKSPDNGMCPRGSTLRSVVALACAAEYIRNPRQLKVHSVQRNHDRRRQRHEQHVGFTPGFASWPFDARLISRIKTILQCRDAAQVHRSTTYEFSIETPQRGMEPL